MYRLVYTINGETVTEDYPDERGSEGHSKYRLLNDKRYAPVQATFSRYDRDGNIMTVCGKPATTSFTIEKVDGTWHEAAFKPDI